MKTKWSILLVSAFLAVHVPFEASAEEILHKKFIQLGWDIPNTTYMRQHFGSMEKNPPFDGIIFYVSATSDGRSTVSTQSAWDTAEWSRDWFTKAREELKACKFKKFTDNFLRFNATPGDIDWSDDLGWTTLCKKAAICAWLAREGGAKGLALDFESYGEKQFRYNPSNGLSFAETSLLARKRGGHFIEAISSEMPNAVILSLFLNSMNLNAGKSGDPNLILPTEDYGLLPAFINGMLDALLPEMILVDGCEHGYYMDGPGEYLHAANEIRSWTGAPIELVAPENRRIYRAQVQAGFGFYLDMYVNPQQSRYYFGPLDGSRLKRLYTNLSAAFIATDQYVWIYGEQCRWWGEPPYQQWEKKLENTAGKGKLWEEALPGITRMISWIGNPIEAAKSEIEALARENALTNLARNPDFSQPPAPNEELPPAYTAWQDERQRTGIFFWDKTIGNGATCVKKVELGCLIQKHQVTPGESYALAIDCLAQGSSLPTLKIRWQRQDGQWTQLHQDEVLTFSPLRTGWQTAFGVITVPQEVGYLVILPCVASQLTDDDICWFDNLRLYKISAFQWQ